MCVWSSDTVDRVIDEALGREEFASCLAIYEEDVGAFDGFGAASSSRGIAKRVLIGQFGAVETGQIAKFANFGLCCDVGCHVQIALARDGDNVVRQGTGTACDFDIFVCGLISTLSYAEMICGSDIPSIVSAVTLALPSPDPICVPWSCGP